MRNHGTWGGGTRLVLSMIGGLLVSAWLAGTAHAFDAPPGWGSGGTPVVTPPPTGLPPGGTTGGPTGGSTGGPTGGGSNPGGGGGSEPPGGIQRLPEPGTLVMGLVGSGLLSLYATYRRRRAQDAE